jgi:hypothetical protein
MRSKIRNGDRYDSWTVIDDTVIGDRKVLCRCDCGTEKRVYRHKLTAGQSTNCGCVHAERMRNQTAPDLGLTFDTEVKPGSRHGRWTALTSPYRDPERRDRVVQVRCDCGTEKTVVAYSLTSAHNPSGSCGCLKRDAKRLALTNTN